MFNDKYNYSWSNLSFVKSYTNSRNYWNDYRWIVFYSVQQFLDFQDTPYRKHVTPPIAQSGEQSTVVELKQVGLFYRHDAGLFVWRVEVVAHYLVLKLTSVFKFIMCYEPIHIQ